MSAPAAGGLEARSPSCGGASDAGVRGVVDSVEGAGASSVAFRRRRPDWRALLSIVLSCLPAAAVIGYDYYYFVFDPVYRVWSAQNLVPSLHLLHYVAGYLLVGALAVLG